MIRTTVWCDGSDELKHRDISARYTGGIASYTASYLNLDGGISARTASFSEADFGLSDKLLSDSDVLVVYSHFFNKWLPGDRIQAIHDSVVHRGMGLVLLHSALYLNAAQRLIGECGYSSYREIGEWEEINAVDIPHPILSGVPKQFRLEHSEMYSEPAGFKDYDDVLFISRYEGGEESRSGITWTRGKGRIFYFSPGHATYDCMLSEAYHTVIRNAVRWAAGRS